MKAIKVLEALELGATVSLFGYSWFLEKDLHGEFALVREIPVSPGKKKVKLHSDVSLSDFIAACEEISEYDLLYIKYEAWKKRKERQENKNE